MEVLMTRVTCLFLFLLPATLLAQDKKPDPKADAAAMKGKWKMVSYTFDGKAADIGDDGRRTLEFTDKEFTTFDGKKKGRTLAFTLDPTADPKRIDITLMGTDTKSPGIYVLDGDDLKICYAEPGGTRPAKMESKAGEKTFLIVLKRVKE
jgi:uncharacterized protein (TIGR03067 family)